MECALQWTDTLAENIYSFANNINTYEGGTHLKSFYSALALTINRYARKHDLLKENEDHLNQQDIKEGLTAIISVKLPEPQFGGETKERLDNHEVEDITQLAVSTCLLDWLNHNSDSAQKIIGKCLKNHTRRK